MLIFRVIVVDQLAQVSQGITAAEAFF